MQALTEKERLQAKEQQRRKKEEEKARLAEEKTRDLMNQCLREQKEHSDLVAKMQDEYQQKQDKMMEVSYTIYIKLKFLALSVIL